MADVAELGIKISTQSVDAAAKKLAGFGKVASAAGAAAVGAFGVLIARQMELIDRQAKLAKSFDTTYASMSNLTRAGSLGGVEFEQLTLASRTLTLQLGEAMRGSEKQSAAFRKLGLDAAALAEMPLDEKFLAINVALKQNVSATEAASLAAEIYGSRVGMLIKELDPETLREGARQAAMFGQSLSQVDAEMVERAGDAMSTFAAASDGLSKQLTVGLSPILEQIGLDFLDVVEKSGGMKKISDDIKGGVIPAVGILVDGVAGIARVFELAGHSAAGIGLAIKGNVEIMELMRLKSAELLQPWEKNTAAGDARKVAIKEMEIQIAATRSMLEFSKEETARLLAEPYTKASDAMNKYIADAELAAKARAEAAVKEAEANKKLNKPKIVDENREKLLADEQKYLESITAMEIEAWNERMDKEREGMEAVKQSLLTEEEAIRASYEERRKIVNDAIMTSGEEKAAILAKLDSQEKAAQADRDAQLNAQQLENYANLFDALHGLYTAFGKESSKTARVLFAISKAAAVGQSMLAISAAAKALGDLAVTTPERIANSAIIAGQVAAIVGTVKSVSMPSGQAHDGIMSVPKSGTWNLEKGERVTTAKTSAALDKTLAGIGKGGANVKIINTIDPLLIRDYMASEAGEEVIMNTISRNQATIRSYSGA